MNARRRRCVGDWLVDDSTPLPALAEHLQLPSLHAASGLGRANAEQVMTEQCHSETVKIEGGNNHRDRVYTRLAKLEARNEARKKREAEVRQLAAIRLRKMMIASIEQEIINLDAAISSELALARVRKPSHFAYSISARTMQGRRENLKATIAALSDRLAFL